jgi:hypothetical protein
MNNACINERTLAQKHKHATHTDMSEFIQSLNARSELIEKQVFDAAGNPVQQYDEDGEPIPMVDKEGNPVDEDDDNAQVGGKKGKGRRGKNVQITLDPAKLLIQRGWLWKKGGGTNRDGLTPLSRRNWKRRYFVLRPSTLSIEYYRSDASRKPLGVIKFFPGTVTSAQELEEFRQHNSSNIDSMRVFYCETASRKFELCADTDGEFEAWMNTISYIITSVEVGRKGGNDRSSRNLKDGLKGGLHGVDAEEAQKLADEARNHTAFGPGLFEGFAGLPMEFTVQVSVD